MGRRDLRSGWAAHHQNSRRLARDHPAFRRQPARAREAIQYGKRQQMQLCGLQPALLHPETVNGLCCPACRCAALLPRRLESPVSDPNQSGCQDKYPPSNRIPKLARRCRTNASPRAGGQQVGRKHAKHHILHTVYNSAGQTFLEVS